MKKRSATLVLVYGALMVLGGLFGFIKAGSLVSLILGSLMGIGLLISGWEISRNKKNGIYAALILAFVIDALFTYRLIMTGKLMPALPICLLSLIVIVVLARDLRKKGNR